MQLVRILLSAIVLAGSLVVFPVPRVDEAMAQQPQCWDMARNRLHDGVPYSPGSEHSGGHRSEGGPRVLGFPVC